ncbi:MAG: FliI/YscN family ATPase [Phycisphaerales bacterium]|nr:FliI/YscN family ATPase [Phycisphaerales bacterium]
MTFLSSTLASIARWQSIGVQGRVSELRGLTLLVEDLPLPVGSLVEVGGRGPGDPPRPGEVVGFTRDRAIVMLLGQTHGIRPGDPVLAGDASASVAVGPSMLGRVLDGLLRPLDGLAPARGLSPTPLSPDPVSAMARDVIRTRLGTGVRAIDLMTPLGRGQRMGVFAGPGVGKSTLLGAIARGTEADVNVIALIGERGREVREFIEHSLGPAGLARSVVIVATGDESPLMRIRAAKAACCVSEYFRARGRAVMLMMDSVTRFAHAQRQVGLSAGEPPATRGYTPSVFAELARLLERAGSMEGSGGSVTGLYTILVEGDDMTEPVADAARGILDGHIILSRKLAQRGHYPAIDVLDSISRVAGEVSDDAHLEARRQAIALLAKHREIEELVQIGAYASGADALADTAIEFEPALTELLRQNLAEGDPFEAARSRLVKVAQQAGESLRMRRAAGPRSRAKAS